MYHPPTRRLSSSIPSHPGLGYEWCPTPLHARCISSDPQKFFYMYFKRGKKRGERELRRKNSCLPPQVHAHIYKDIGVSTRSMLTEYIQKIVMKQDADFLPPHARDLLHNFNYRSICISLLKRQVLT